jgi:hypothetical protein
VFSWVISWESWLHLCVKEPNFYCFPSDIPMILLRTRFSCLLSSNDKIGGLVVVQ